MTRRHGSKLNHAIADTAANGNTMFQGLVSKLLLPTNSWRYFRAAAVGIRGRICLIFFSNFYSRGCTRRHILFSGVNCKQADKKSAHLTIDLRPRHRLNPRPTRSVSGKGNACRWRPRRHQADPRSRGRELAGGVLRYPLKPAKECRNLEAVYFLLGVTSTCFFTPWLVHDYYVSTMEGQDVSAAVRLFRVYLLLLGQRLVRNSYPPP